MFSDGETQHVMMSTVSEVANAIPGKIPTGIFPCAFNKYPRKTVTLFTYQCQDGDAVHDKENL